VENTTFFGLRTVCASLNVTPSRDALEGGRHERDTTSDIITPRSALGELLWKKFLNKLQARPATPRT